ncbi:Alkaline phosphodiesterase [Wickerhamomyces ciferrii]|uniref:Alkaline phosphodiesterase n=1 Tax=Wickerhamomyces ciferrii (strain ATCC 14091 / BCRC 22168 / CBS 111 / JCM 3599 / NBRC 0793 / NRRL Y-1031 F-60-10) TaxID=1206466 RepID=K0KHN0_WICCF|nr:Alkaline phosphodiesterase [Wickerhamomyces ciferrii]CCH42521.1 Alkaline phosphodiesterase [Wickerhamomyces ciferrii]
MSGGFPIDTPIQDLDEDEDDFLGDDSDTNINTLRDEFNLDGDSNPLSGNKNSWISNGIDKLKNVFSKGYGRLPNTGIELDKFNDTNYDVDSFTDLGIVKDEGLTWLDFLKKYLSYLLIFALLVTVVVLSVLLSRKSSGSDKVIRQTLSNGTDLFYPTTILISLDGFHPHYISSSLTPTLHSFLQKGYGPPYMIPSFPSSTFPNHWTIATGLYPESHGIVGNTFFDSNSQREFVNILPDKSLDPSFWGGEPIWSTAESQGVRSAIHMFPGSEVKFKKGNKNPSIVDRFNKTETLEVKSNRILEWIDKDFKERPQLIIGYVPNIDTVGHKTGIKGKKLEEELKYVDSFVKNLTQGIANRNASDIVNLVFVSDHGMAPTSNDRLIYLDDLIDIKKVQHHDGWPLFGLRPIPNVTAQELHNDLKATYHDNSGYSFYLREDLPKEWNFGGKKVNQYTDRIAPIWVVPDVGYAITSHDDMERKNGEYSPKGVHGYNNTEVLMRAIFLGTGPYFKSKFDNVETKVRPFKNIEVYNILCETLNLKPAINNGSTNIFSIDNKLEESWKDKFVYPGVNFDIGGILKHDPTYDKLFRVEEAKDTTTLQSPAKAHKTSKTNDHSKQESKQKPTDTAKDGDHTKKSKQTPTPTPKPKDESKHKEQPSHTENTKSQEPKPSKHKGFFENLGEDFKDLGEDLREGIEDIVEDVEDAFDKFTGHKDD